MSFLKPRKNARAARAAEQAGAQAPVGPWPSQGAAGPHVLSEFERLLRRPECPACTYIDESERSFFSWLQIESFSVAEVQARLRASMGMCPVHSRRLVEEIGEGHVMTILMREALAGARQRARDERQPGPCPACEATAFAAQRARHMVLEGLGDPAQARLYSEHDGVCLTHFLQIAPELERSTVGPLADRLLRSLAEAKDTGLISLLGGSDHDARRRAHWRDRLPEPAGAGSTLEQLHARFEVDACPVCLPTGLAERDYVRWVLEHTAQDDPSLRSDPGELCPGHLHDLALADPALAARAIEHKRATALGRITRMQDLRYKPYCPACNARDAIEHSQLDLVVAALGVSTVRDRYERSHGLCLWHAVQVSDGQAARLARRHVDARLGVLAWEVGETARKYAWAYRHESDGHEQHAWLRALAQIDGRVFEGGSARTDMPRSDSDPA